MWWRVWRSVRRNTRDRDTKFNISVIYNRCETIIYIETSITFFKSNKSLLPLDGEFKDNTPHLIQNYKILIM